MYFVVGIRSLCCLMFLAVACPSLAGSWQRCRLLEVACIVGESLVVLAGRWQYGLVAGIVGESLVVLAGRWRCWRVVSGVGKSGFSWRAPGLRMYSLL